MIYIWNKIHKVGDAMDKYKRQEKKLILLCMIVAFVMLLSWIRHLFS
jgi:hypothetical protein